MYVEEGETGETGQESLVTEVLLDSSTITLAPLNSLFLENDLRQVSTRNIYSFPVLRFSEGDCYYASLNLSIFVRETPKSSCKVLGINKNPYLHFRFSNQNVHITKRLYEHEDYELILSYITVGI